MCRRVTAFYNLEDPLEILQHPWKSDRWREHCRKTVSDYWLELLVQSCEEYSTLNLFDSSRLHLKSPHPIWTAAGRDSTSTKRATIVLWFLLGAYNTGERLFKMGKNKSPNCVLCTEQSLSTQVDDRAHFLLSCPAFGDIREDFLSQFVVLSPALVNHMEVSDTFLVCLLDPFSPLVPSDIRQSWSSGEAVYEASRNFCFAMHNRRTKLLDSMTSQEHDH